MLTLQQQLDALPPPPPPPPPRRRSSSMRSLGGAAAAAARARRERVGLRRIASDAAVAENTTPAGTQLATLAAPTVRGDFETARQALRRLGAADDDDDIEVLACFCLPESITMRQRSVPLPPSAQLDLMREMKGLIEAVPPQEREIVPAARWPGDVLRAVERGLSPRIFHVSSHGVRKDTWWHDGGDTLLFHRTDGGAALPEREEVVDVLRRCGDGLELLFLNACASVDLARYVANKLPGLKVVCWQGRVHDACARCFARAFYNHVGEWPGGDVAVAFAAALAILRQEYVVGDPDPAGLPVLVPGKREAPRDRCRCSSLPDLPFCVNQIDQLQQHHQVRLHTAGSRVCGPSASTVAEWSGGAGGGGPSVQKSGCGSPSRKRRRCSVAYACRSAACGGETRRRRPPSPRASYSVERWRAARAGPRRLPRRQDRDVPDAGDDGGVVAHRQGDEVADARQRPAGARGALRVIGLEAPVEPAAALEAALVGLQRVVEREEALDRPPAREPLAPARVQAVGAAVEVGRQRALERPLLCPPRRARGRRRGRRGPTAPRRRRRRRGGPRGPRSSRRSPARDSFV